MGEGAITFIANQAIWLLIKVSLPFLLVALSVGLIISLFQALTQIQEPTLSFVPKIIAIFGTILLSLNYIGVQFSSFMDLVFENITNLS